MSSYTIASRPTRLRDGDTVIFEVPDAAMMGGAVRKITYNVNDDHLGNSGPGSNESVFILLGLQKVAFCRQHYGYSPRGNGDWPVSRDGDFEALTRVTNALYDILARMGISETDALAGIFLEDGVPSLVSKAVARVLMMLEEAPRLTAAKCVQHPEVLSVLDEAGVQRIIDLLNTSSEVSNLITYLAAHKTGRTIKMEGDFPAIWYYEFLSYLSESRGRNISGGDIADHWNWLKGADMQNVAHKLIKAGIVDMGRGWIISDPDKAQAILREPPKEADIKKFSLQKPWWD